jgi:hypothetical protein
VAHKLAPYLPAIAAPSCTVRPELGGALAENARRHGVVIVLIPTKKGPQGSGAGLRLDPAAVY